MKSIDDYFENEGGLACEFGGNLPVCPIEDAKRIAVDYANQFQNKWISIHDETKPFAFETVLLKYKDEKLVFFRTGYYNNLYFTCHSQDYESSDLIQWQYIS